MWVPGDVSERPFKGVDEAHSDCLSGLAAVVVERGVDVVGGAPAQLGRLGHEAQSLEWRRLRRSEK